MVDVAAPPLPIDICVDSFSKPKSPESGGGDCGPGRGRGGRGTNASGGRRQKVKDPVFDGQKPRNVILRLRDRQDRRLLRCRRLMGEGRVIARMLSVDGCNIGRAAQGPERLYVDSLALISIFRFLIVRNFDIAVFIPQSYGRVASKRVIHGELLEMLEKAGCLSLTTTCAATSRRLAFINYDDLYTLEFAMTKGGTVVSGDRFRDIRVDARYPHYRQLMDERQITIQCHLLEDPWLEDGIDRMYRVFPQIVLPHWFQDNDVLLANSLYCNLDNKHDQTTMCAMYRREEFTCDKRRRLLEVIDALMDRFQYPLPLGLPMRVQKARKSKKYYRVLRGFEDTLVKKHPASASATQAPPAAS